MLKWDYFFRPMMVLDKGGESGGGGGGGGRESPGSADRYNEDNPSGGSSGGTTAVVTPSVTASVWAPTYQTWTMEQLAAAGIDPNTFFTQYSGQLNPNGDASVGWYAGMPVAAGYVDQNGQFVGQVAPGVYQSAYLKRNTDPMAWMQENTPWQDITQTGAYQGMQGVLGQMQNYPNSPEYQQDRNASFQSLVESLRGWDAGSYTNNMASMNAGLGGGVAGMQGYSPEDATKYQRQIQSQIEQMTTDTREMVGALGASGKSIAAFDAAINARSSIGDYQIQSQLAFMENDYAKKLVEYNALNEQRTQAQAQGMAGAEQFDQMLQSSWEGMVQGYATEISALSEANSQYLEAFTAHSQAMYQSMLSEIGVSQAAFDTAAESFAQANMPTTQAQWDELWQDFMDWWGKNS
jgi:hypothetical protein